MSSTMESFLNWAWISGELNPADWCMKSRPVEKINDSFWKHGPEFLQQEEETWSMKFTFKTDCLDGEIVINLKLAVYFQSTSIDILGRLVDRSSQWKRLLRVLCWILRLGDIRSEHVTSGGVGTA